MPQFSLSEDVIAIVVILATVFGALFIKKFFDNLETQDNKDTKGDKN